MTPVKPQLRAYLNKIHQGDAVDLMNQLPANSVDLIVTSPPYNLRNSTGNGMLDGRGGKWSNAALLDGYAGHQDAMPYQEYVTWQRACLVGMMRVLKPTGAIFYVHKWRVQAGLLQDRQEIVEGFPVRQIIIWQRAGGLNFNPGYFLPTYEVIYLIAGPEFKLVPQANAIGDIWHIPQVSRGLTPATFPVELACQCIASTEAEVILDPFMGSGTTAIAAEMEGRQWVGIELSEEYCGIARKRIARVG